MKTNKPRAKAPAKTAASRSKAVSKASVKPKQTARSTSTTHAKAKVVAKKTAASKSVPKQNQRASASRASTTRKKRPTKISFFRRRSTLVGTAVVVIAIAIAGITQLQRASSAVVNPASTARSSSYEPRLSHTVLARGLSHPWDVAELPSGDILFTQRGGTLHQIRGTQVKQVARISRADVKGEGGVMGMAVDKQYAKNNYIYVCFNTRVNNQSRAFVTRYVYRDSKIISRKDIIKDIPSSPSGRHSGCQVETANDGTLWVATGDATSSTTPQNPKSLGGKILHVNRDGKGVSGNMGGSFDPRVFSYGHRNSQGLYIFDKPVNGNYGFSAEHGSGIEDEMNQLRRGNFGWAPGAPYNEGVPMTDTRRFPNAIRATWNSGRSTIAISGLTRLQGAQWGNWNGAYVMGVLKGKQLKLIQLNGDGKIVWEKTVKKDAFGRIRAVVMAKDGSLLITTDNGRNSDQVIRIRASR